jgi:hypothetical protein
LWINEEDVGRAKRTDLEAVREKEHACHSVDSMNLGQHFVLFGN